MTFSSFRNSGHHFPTSLMVWNAMDRLGTRWRKLDKFVRDGAHDRMLDLAVGTIRGRNVLHPFSYYQDGWGDVSVASSFYAWLETFAKEMEAIKARQQSVRTWIPRKIDINLSNSTSQGGVTVREGRFKTCALEIKHLLPSESLEARALFVTPSSSIKGTEVFTSNAPIVVILAGTGEHGYGRRASSLAFPLAAELGISSVILESPFYGTRRPPNQIGSKLRRVSDLAVLGRVTIEETCSLFRYMQEEMGTSNMAVAGVSMGGLHSAMTASLSPLPLGVVSWLGPPSAAPVFTDGLLARFCEWTRLQNELGKEAVAKDVMRRFLGLTDITNFPGPVDSTRGIFVIAENDLYVPAEHSISTWQSMQRDKWKGSRIVTIPGGHISATLFGAQAMRRCIANVLGVSKVDPFVR